MNTQSMGLAVITGASIGDRGGLCGSVGAPRVRSASGCPEQEASWRSWPRSLPVRRAAKSKL